MTVEVDPFTVTRVAVGGIAPGPRLIPGDLDRSGAAGVGVGLQVGCPGAKVVSLGYTEFDAAEVWLVLPVVLVADTVKLTWVPGSSPSTTTDVPSPALTVLGAPDVLGIKV